LGPVDIFPALLSRGVPVLTIVFPGRAILEKHQKGKVFEVAGGSVLDDPMLDVFEGQKKKRVSGDRPSSENVWRGVPC